MVRRIVLVLLLAGVVGVWNLLVADDAVDGGSVTEAAYTPNLANGEIIFNAGGCSSCHAVPGQPDRLKLGGGLALAVAVRHLLRAEHLAGSG